eukprot:186966-Chlamydomonas_euryale.AAC.3
MGVASVACVSGCVCEKHEWDCNDASDPTSQTHFHTVRVSQVRPGHAAGNGPGDTNRFTYVMTDVLQQPRVDPTILVWRHAQ